MGKEEFKASENFFQASKFVAGTPDYEWARDYTGSYGEFPKEANKRVVGGPKLGWENDKVMWRAIAAKFRQHESVRKQLLATGDAVIVENSPYDRFWGIGPDGEGENKLGKFLMIMREQFRQFGNVDDEPSDAVMDLMASSSKSSAQTFIDGYKKAALS